MQEESRVESPAGGCDGESGRTKMSVTGGGSYLWSHKIIEDAVLSEA